MDKVDERPDGVFIVRAKQAIADAAKSQRRDTARAMRARSPAKTLKMAERALERAEKTIAKTLKLVPPPRPIACRAGCPWCCHIRLTMSPPEALLVLKHIHDSFGGEEIRALRRKVANIDGHTRALDGAARARLRLPCPLLREGSCSVHRVRPLSCRAVASVDVDACKRAYHSRMEEPVPQHGLQYQAANGVGYGIYAGLVDSGFEVEDVEMNAALALGLETPGLIASWLKGEAVFAAATVVISRPRRF